MKPLRIIIGIALWLIGLLAIGWCVDNRMAKDVSLSKTVIPDLLQYATNSRQEAELVFETQRPVGVGDPIVIQLANGQYQQLGEISSVSKNEVPARVAHTKVATAVFVSSDYERHDIKGLIHYETSNSMDWVLATMLTQENRAKIANEVQRAVNDHRTVIMAELRPLVERSLRDSMKILETDLAASIKRHRGEIEKVAGRYQKDVLEKELVPLVKTEIFPIVKTHAEPLANEIGIALWKRVSLWRFTWRYLYDKSPLPERNKFKKEWDRFLEKEAMPVLDERTADILDVVRKIVRETTRNEKVKRTIRENVIKVVDDPALRKIVWTIINETVVENPRLREAMTDVWTSDEARDALQLASERVEPSVQNIGRLLFGSPEDGITPEFAKVLRNRILQKDKRWFVVVVDESGTGAGRIPVRKGEGRPPYPLAVLKTDSSGVSNVEND